MLMANTSEHPIAIIGGGLGGLAAACTLAARGHRVALFEKNSWLGGKAAVHHDSGFRFDMGPTILLMPFVLRRIFSEAGVKLEEVLDLVRLDPQWRCFFDDGGVLDLVEDPQRMAGNINRLAPGTAADRQYTQMLRQSQLMRNASDKYFFWKSIGSIRDTFDFKGSLQLSVLRDLMNMKLGRTLGATVRSIIHEPRIAQMVDHFTQYVGSAPALSPAVLMGIADMQISEGIWYPRGGTRAVPEALEKLARKLGVDIYTQCAVHHISTDGRRVRAVVTADGREIPVSAVISNSDVVLTHQELLPQEPARRFQNRRRYEPACSGVVLYLGLKQRYDHLAHHDFVFSRDPEQEFQDIYQRGIPAADPTCYLCAPAISDPSVAPAGGEALYILVHTPYLRPGQDWKKMLPEYRRVIFDKLARTAGLQDLESRIVTQRALTPEDIRDRYHVWNGAIYGLASHGRFNGAFKPANRSRDVAGLYLAGGSAHPGPGMPMALMSGWIAADALDTDVRNRIAS
jgi:phytoene desaturase